MAVNDIVPPHLAVQAMRDNGYKNAAYAIAELVDNSIEAGATDVTVCLAESVEQLSQRQRVRIQEIGILDNGNGMGPEVLQMALQFGNGTHLLKAAQTGIGKFGMGLPASSISQCSRVDVYTWTDGLDSVHHTYLDIDEIKTKKQIGIPEPKKSSLPSHLRKLKVDLGLSGTYVQWSKLDRLQWKTARAVEINSEFLIGRMYRHFLVGDRVRIRFYAFDLATPGSTGTTRITAARPNDPLYLMSGTSTPDPYGDQPMFAPYFEDRTIMIPFEGADHPVRIRASIADQEARKGRNAGSTPYGKHAARNVGVSIVRSDRELELNESWCIPYDPRERWWGIEISFGPGLDEFFGVTNNKQYARHLNRVTIDDYLEDSGLTETALREKMEQENSPEYHRIRLSDEIHELAVALRGAIKVQKVGTDGEGRRQFEDERHATDVTRQRKDEGFAGESDRDEDLPDDEKEKVLTESIKRLVGDAAAAASLAKDVVAGDLKYVVVPSASDSPAFFTVQKMVGKLVLSLNTDHPAYSHLIEVLDEPDGETERTVKERLDSARSALRLLLMAWARYEDELTGSRKREARDVRVDWGRVARQFLE
jgi:transcriptional regulator of met regulon